MGNFKEDIAKIKAFAFDCDGVLTDGSVTVNERGEAIRTFNAKDGYAVVRALKKGYPVALISGGVGDVMRVRFEQLGIQHIYLGSKNKLQDLDHFRSQYNLERTDILYIGDDIPDMEVMSVCGVSVAPCDAAMEVKQIATHVTEYAGGRGCVRDALEQVMKARGDWDVFVKHSCV